MGKRKHEFLQKISFYKGVFLHEFLRLCLEARSLLEILLLIRFFIQHSVPALVQGLCWAHWAGAGSARAARR